MLSIKSFGASDAVGIANYFETLGVVDDYYQSGCEPPGFWIGTGVNRLGLSQTLQEGELARVLLGVHPVTEKPLAKNAGNDHKPGWDCTFSSPKSVSAIWAVAEPALREKIELAQRSSVEFAVNYLERNAVRTRHGLGGREVRPVARSGGLVAAAYEHGTSRAGDPQLHTHVIIANVTPAGRGIDIDLNHKMAAGALYRAELASRLREIGFSISADGDSFKVVGVPEALVDHWSQRRKEIIAEMARVGHHSGSASDIAALATRDAKVASPRHELYVRWQAEARDHGFTWQSAKQLVEARTADRDHAPQMLTPKEIMAAATSHHATVSAVQVLHATAVAAQGHLDGARSEQHARGIMEGPEVVRLKQVAREHADEWHKTGQRFTTPELLAIESAMQARVLVLSQDTNHQLSREAINDASASRPTLSDAQQRAVQHIVGDGGGVVVLEGVAGSGKTYTLAVANSAWEAAGMRVIGTAVSNRATRQLAEEANIKSFNSTKLEVELNIGRLRLDAKTVLVVDESGMVSTRQLARLVDRVADAQAKLVLVGDSRQLQAIEAGAPMRAIAAAIGSHQLNEVRRQRDPAEREIAALFRAGHADEALLRLAAKDRLDVASDMATARDRAATRYIADRAAGSVTLLVAATRAEVRELNKRVRHHLREVGEIASDGILVDTSSGFREIAVGDKVIFGKRADFGPRGDDRFAVWNGVTGKVVGAAEGERYSGTLRVMLDHSGHEVTVNTKQFAHIDHGYATTVHKAQAATVDTCHVLAGEVGGREWAYVAGSRHRQSVTFYTSEEHVGELAQAMSRARQNDNVLDYPVDGHREASTVRKDEPQCERDVDREM